MAFPRCEGIHFGRGSRLNRDVGTQEMNIRHIATIISLICLVGCASNDTEQNFDHALKAHWSKVSESDFPLPAATPFDTDTILRDKYLKGYADGVHEILIEYRNNALTFGDRFLLSEDARPYFEGNRDGALAVIERAPLINDAVTQEQMNKWK